MAIFQKEITKKVLLDDTESVSCVIENYHNINGHTEYIIRVQRGPLRDKSWHIYKRYNDFLALHSVLQTSGLQLPFPPKKLLGNMDREFICERQQALQNYLNLVLMNPILASSLPTKRFLDPDNYSTPFHESALQHVSLALRGEVGWEVVGPQPEIGWRLRKHYFQVRCKSLPNEELFASWLDFGPDKYLDDKEMQSVFKSMAQLRHPCIQPLELCLCTETGGLAVRKAYRDGSVRDHLCAARPRHSFLRKYGSPKGHTRLPHHHLALFGKQILETLKFLHDKGLPYGHLHPGNIFVEGEQVRLSELENGVLGVPSFYRPYFVQHKRINSLPAIDVYSFGHSLYEMAFGYPLHESVCDSFPPDCPSLLRSVLESILSSEACKAGLPTVDNLLAHPFFAAEGGTYAPDKKALKLPTALKEQLREAQRQLEERLREEQRTVRSQKRLARVQEMLSTEEDRRKRKHKSKSEQQKQAGREHVEEGATTGGLAHNGAERCESVNSTSTTASMGTGTPPSITDGHVPSPPPPPLPPPPPPPPATGASLPAGGAPQAGSERAALLGSICSFNKNNLRKTSHQNRIHY